MAGWPVGQLVVSDSDAFPNGAPFTYTIISGNPDQEFRVHSDGTLYTAAKLNTRLRTVYYLQVRATDSGFPPLHKDTWVTVKVNAQFVNNVWFGCFSLLNGVSIVLLFDVRSDNVTYCKCIFDRISSCANCQQLCTEVLIILIYYTDGVAQLNF